ncbi:U3 small nucleolar RNA-associated protein 13, partial [Nowakowskiella sp. JEL0078]
SKDGGILVSGSKDNSVRIWKANFDTSIADDRFSCVGLGIGHTEAVGAVAITKKTKDFIFSGSQDRTVKCWGISGKALGNDVSGEPSKLKAVFTFQAHEKDINSISVSPNDKLIATASQDKTAKIWSAADGKLIGTCTGHRRGVWCAEFSPVDQVLATSSGDKNIKLWSLSDFTCLKVGMQLVSSGSDGLVKIWTIKSNICDATLDNHEDKVWGVTVRKDDKLIVSGAADSVVTIWKDTTLEKREEDLREKELLVLKEQELSNFIQRKDYRNAVFIALDLDHPYKLVNLFTEILKVAGEPQVDSIIRVLDDNQ